MGIDSNDKTSAMPQRRNGIMRVIGKILDYATPLAISVGLVVWLFHKVKFNEIVEIVRQGCDFRYLVLMMAITTLSHMIRGIRWGIQLRGAGVERMPVIRESVAIFGAYSLNLVFPRLGEAWRCMYVSRREKVPLSTVVGTDLGDRTSDLVVVILLFILSLIVAHGAMDAFINHYSFGQDIDHIIKEPLLWLGVSAAVAAAWSLLHYFRKIKWVQKVDDSLQKMWVGFKVLFTMKGQAQYVILTIGIWVCYYLETYVTFFAFPFTRELISQPGLAYGLIPGLVVFVFGSFSMAVPSNGGLGPWNLAVMFALSLYGISDSQGTAFSMVMWSSQAACLVVLGLFSAGYVFWDNHKMRRLAALSTPASSSAQTSSTSAPSSSTAPKS